jgi:hypothetical protein
VRSLDLMSSDLESEPSTTPRASLARVENSVETTQSEPRGIGTQGIASASTLLALIPMGGYAAAFAYEVGGAIQFGIPIRLLRIELMGIALASTVIAGFGLYWWWYSKASLFSRALARFLTATVGWPSEKRATDAARGTFLKGVSDLLTANYDPTGSLAEAVLNTVGQRNPRMVLEAQLKGLLGSIVAVATLSFTVGVLEAGLTEVHPLTTIDGENAVVLRIYEDGFIGSRIANKGVGPTYFFAKFGDVPTRMTITDLGRLAAAPPATALHDQPSSQPKPTKESVQRGPDAGGEIRP